MFRKNAFSLKRKLSLLLGWLLLAAPVMVQAQVNYAISGNTAYVASSPSAAGDIVISNIYNGYPVTSIGFQAFLGCYGLTSVTIGTNVTTIGTNAFLSCSGLTSVTIPNSVTSIGVATFAQCSGLTNVTIPNSVTSIGQNAFNDCTSLTSVTIPNSVTSIGDYAFAICTSLTNIAVAADNPAYSSVNGVLFDKTQATLIAFPNGLGGSYAIPNSVTSIGEGAFNFCKNLTNVTIPNSVTNLGTQAFGHCHNPTSAIFQGNAPSDDGNAFFFTVATVYYYYGTSGWGSTYDGHSPTVMLGAPAPQVGSGSIGVPSGNFGFTLTGVTNQTVMVEASTNLVDWQPVWTNTLSGASTNFTDAQWTNYPSRFYRVSSP